METFVCLSQAFKKWLQTIFIVKNTFPMIGTPYPHNPPDPPDPTRPDPTRPNPTRPDSTRPDPTRPDQT